MRAHLPDSLVARAREYDAAGLTPVAPADAATVLLLRDGSDGAGLEVFVMVRRTSMTFAGGMVAFPGGKVEPFDALPVEDSLAARMGAPVEQAGALVAAALRETTEETGVVLDPAALGLWDAWTTPVFEPRRYRTWFFTAELPPGQEALELSTESSSVAWISPAVAAARADADEWMMLPPTYLACRRLAGFGSVAEVMAATSTASVQMFTPEIVGGAMTQPDWAERL